MPGQLLLVKLVGQCEWGQSTPENLCDLLLARYDILWSLCCTAHLQPHQLEPDPPDALQL